MSAGVFEETTRDRNRAGGGGGSTVLEPGNGDMWNSDTCVGHL